MLFGKKKRKSQKASEMTPAPVAKTYKTPTAQEYKRYIETAVRSCEDMLSSYGDVTEALRLSAKKISRVKGIFSQKLSGRKERKYGHRIANYNECLDAYIEASATLNRMIETIGSCYEGLALQSNSARAARSIRIEGERYVAKVMFKKAKLDKKIDGIVMPVSNYVK